MIFFATFPPFFLSHYLGIHSPFKLIFIGKTRPFIIFATFQISTPFQYSHFPCIHSFIEFYDVDLLLDILICSYIQDIYIFYRSVIFWSFAGWNISYSSQAKGWQKPPKFLWENFPIKHFAWYLPNFCGRNLHQNFFTGKCSLISLRFCWWRKCFLLPILQGDFCSEKLLHRSMVIDHILWVICLTFLLTSRTDRGGRR